MEIRMLDGKSYKIHTLKSNRYKYSNIEIVFKLKASLETMPIYSFLTDMLMESCKKYPTRKDMLIKSEELYKVCFNIVPIRCGETLCLSLNASFINPDYIEEDNYLENVIKYIFDILLDPNVQNNEFDKNSFEIVKKNVLLGIESIKENPNRLAIKNALKVMENNSLISSKLYGNKEDAQKITPSLLYDAYKNLIDTADIDIYVLGNINMEDVTSLIKKYYKNNRIRNNNYNFFIEPSLSRKIKYKEDKSSYDQTRLVCLYNLKNLTMLEKQVTFHVFNCMFGNGGLNSKLYSYVREQNSLCYQISSMYFMYDNILCIGSSLARENVDKALKLIDEALKEMQKGKFTSKDLEDAKNNMMLSLNINKDNPHSILDNYQNKIYYGGYTVLEKQDELAKVSKEDIINVAKKIKPNTIYILSEANNE